MVVLVVYVSCLVVLIVVMSGLIVVRMMIMLELGHRLDPISLMVLSVHHDMLTLMSSVLIHIERAVCGGGVRRRPRWRRSIVTEGPPTSLRRAGTVGIPLCVVLIVWEIERSSSRLVEPELTIGHLTRDPQP